MHLKAQKIMPLKVTAAEMQSYDFHWAACGVFHPACASLSAAIFTYTSAKRRGKEIYPLSLRAPAVRLGLRGVSAGRKWAIQGADRESQGAARRWFFRRSAKNL